MISFVNEVENLGIGKAVKMLVSIYHMYLLSTFCMSYIVLDPSEES